jgi:predicted  nucleic acid-binding Zn-ribbon protein
MHGIARSNWMKVRGSDDVRGWSNSGSLYDARHDLSKLGDFGTELGAVRIGKIEKYKTQQFQVKTNKQYDTLAREIDFAQEKITKMQKEMEALEGKAMNAKDDAEKLAPEIETSQSELSDRKKELAAVNKEHEDEELKLQHQREKIASRVSKADYQMYDRIRKAKEGRAVVPVQRNSCGG